MIATLMIPDKAKGTRKLIYRMPKGFSSDNLRFELLGFRRFAGIRVIEIALNPSDMESAREFDDEVKIAPDQNVSPGSISICIDVSGHSAVGNPPKFPLRPLESEQYKQMRAVRMACSQPSGS